MILKLKLHQQKKKKNTHCIFTGNRNVCQELVFFLVSVFSHIYELPVTFKTFWRKMSAVKFLKTETDKKSACHEEEGGRTVQHLLGNGRCWRAAAGSHFPSINMVGIELSVILERARKKNRWGVWCALGIVDDMTWILHNIFKILDVLCLYHTVTACSL